MKNITLAIDDELLEAARACAAARDTTVNALVRSHLASLVSTEARARDVRRGLVELAE